MADEVTTAAPAAPAPAATSAAAALAGTPATATTGAPATEAPATTEAAPAGLALPGKDATPEQWNEFYGKLGRPETADGYELPVPEGDDGAFAKSMAPVLHKHGISAEQAKGLAADWNAMVAEQQATAAKAETDRIAALDAKNTAEQGELKQELGEKFEAQTELAKRAVRQFANQEHAADILTAIEDKIGYKATMKFFMGIGAGLGEHDAGAQAVTSNGQGERTPTEQLFYPSNYGKK